MGAKFYDFIVSNSLYSLTFFENNFKDSNSRNKNFIEEFIHGIKLKSYNFDKYKTKKKINYLKYPYL